MMPPETHKKNNQKFFNKQILTKMSVRNYIDNARRGSSFQNWTGDAAAQNGGYRNMVGNSVNFSERTPIAGPNQKFNANGGGNNAPQSQPYILTVSNASAASVSNFDVLGAFTYIGNAGFANGSLTISGVTISSAISNVNYQQFLYQSMQQPFSVGLTYIESVSGSSAQITQTFTLNTQDANGNQLLRTIVPTIDPYQQQSTIVAVKQQYSIDGFTKLTFTTIGASVVFRIHFYPSTNINLSAGLQGQSVAQAYGNPNIVGVPTYIQG